MDIRIAGTGSVPPGEYDSVTVRGSGRVFGEVRCLTFRACGTCKGESVTCAEDFKASGTSTFSRKIEAKSIRTSGSCSCGGSIKAEESLTCHGSLKCAGIEAKNVKLVGSARCEGALRAQNAVLQADKQMHLESIRAQTILIKRKRISIFPKRGAHVSSDIEGDTLALSHVTCPRVTGRTVTVGKGCRIDLVQYRDELRVSPKAKIGKIEKI